MRVKVFAVIPALFVLVSLCGSPVPPPPGTVSGSVFFDANRNGIRDSCDSPMKNTQVVVVNGYDGSTSNAKTNDNGEFKVEAPVLDGIVTLFTDESYVWPITTDPQPVHVESLKAVTGVEIGSASRAVYDANKMSISGVIFDDANGDGEIDRDECPIAGSSGGLQVSSRDRIAVVAYGGTYELKNLPEGHEAEVTASYGSFSNDRSANPQPLRPTGGSRGGEPCESIYKAKPRYGAVVYEANLGFSLLTGDLSVSGVVFDDRDGDGLQGETEAGVAGMVVRLIASDGCPNYFRDLSVTTGDDGSYRVTGLYPGTFSASLDIVQVGEFNFATMSSPSLTTVAVPGGRPATLNVPVKIAPGGSFRVAIFDDDNGDGARGFDEDSGAGVVICVYPEPPPMYGGDGHGYGYGDCRPAGEDGIATIEPLPEGTYSVSVSNLPLGTTVYPEPLIATVASGEETALIFPIDLVQPEEQVISPGQGTPAEYHVCSDDPTWEKPAFDSLWNEDIAAQTQLDEATARKIYGHDIYGSGLVYGAGEVSTWAAIVGLTFSETLPTCERPLTGARFLLYGYKVIDVVLSGNVKQIRVARTEVGRQTIAFPGFSDVPPTLAIHLIVDESYSAIVRYSYDSCEWNDGTTPNYYMGGFSPGYIGP